MGAGLRGEEEMTELDFKKTCGFCPEQYDVFLGRKQVGYIRLRHGCLRVDFPKCGGEVIYKKQFGDPFREEKGCFDNDKERQRYLRIIGKKIIKKLKEVN